MSVRCNRDGIRSSDRFDTKHYNVNIISYFFNFLQLTSVESNKILTYMYYTIIYKYVYTYIYTHTVPYALLTHIYIYIFKDEEALYQNLKDLS